MYSEIILNVNGHDVKVTTDQDIEAPGWAESMAAHIKKIEAAPLLKQ